MEYVKLNPVKFKCSPSSDIDWKTRTSGARDFSDRLADAYMGKTLKSDMTFFVESDNISIPAHSLIIAAASAVLERCIFGVGSIVNSDRVVTIADCPLNDFKVLLRYLYNGSVKDLTIDTASVLLPLAHFFDLQQLEEICTKCIEETVMPKNVCKTFDNIHLMDTPLTALCIDIIQLNITEVLADGSMMQMQDAALNKILLEDSLILPCESDIFKPMLNWADKKLANVNLPVTAINRRDIIKERIYLVRFAAMTPIAFSLCLSMVGTDFFSDEEIRDIMLCISMGADYYNKTRIVKPFNCKRRMLCLTVKSQENYDALVCGQSVEIIHMKNSKNDFTILGFETVFDISNIYEDELNTVRLEFVKTGNRVMFTSPRTFEDGMCSFYVNSFERFGLSVTVANDPNLYLDTGSVTLVSAIIYE